MAESADASPSSWSWVEDDPLTNPEADPRHKYFEHDAFTAAVSDIIHQSYGNNPSSTTFALIGPWGSGKTTVLSTVEKALVGRNWWVQHFNPWYYPDSASLTWGFFDALRDRLPKAQRWTDTRKALDGLRQVVTPVAKLGALVGVDFSDQVSELLNKDRVNAVTIRDKVAAKLEKLPHPVLMILDDLDRLTSAELLETFKLVRFIGRLPNVNYLLCYDEQTLTDMINNTDLVGDAGDRRALDYLEKIVQIRFDLPPVREDRAEELVYTSIIGLLDRANITITVEAERRLERMIVDPVCERLRTPRAVKHFMAQLEAFLPSVASEVDWADFVLITWVRCFEPALYTRVQHEKQKFTSQRRTTTLGNAQPETDRVWFQKALEDANVSETNRNGVTAVLEELFPAVSSWVNSRAYAGIEPDPGRIANRDYFDRFFAFGVPADDLPDLTVRDAIEHLDDATNESLTRVYTQLCDNPRRTVLKLKQEAAAPGTALDVTKWLIRSINDLPAPNTWLSPFNQAVWLAGVLLGRTNEHDYQALVANLDTTTLNPTYLLADAAETLLLQKSGGQAHVQELNQKGRKLADLLIPRLPDILNDHATNDVLSDDDVFMVFRPWQSIDPDGPRNYIAERVNAGAWTEFDVLARFVNYTVPHGTNDRVGTISGLDPEWASRFVDVERALRNVPADAPPPLSEFKGFHDVDATPANRRAFLLWFRDHRPPPVVAG